MSDYSHSREVGSDICNCGADVCADCLECLDDTESHCSDCGGHMDGLGECEAGCAP